VSDRTLKILLLATQVIIILCALRIILLVLSK
jgi:hypothetical protein